MAKFKVGDQITIRDYSKEWNGILAVIKSIDGEYHYVTPLGYEHEIELYPCELAVYWEDL